MRILMASGYGYWGDFSPEDLSSETKQVGGGETAMVSIAKGLANLGHEVIVFYDVNRFGKYCGVDYLPTSFFVQMATTMEHDVLVSWDNPHLFRFADRACVRVLAFQLNDAFVGAFDWTIDAYFHPSQWHADMFHKLYPEITAKKSVVRITNGVDYMRYAQAQERDPHRIIYSASPDRGLHHLLRMWPAILERDPLANLHVFYDVAKWLQMDEEMAGQGIVNVTAERASLIRGYIKSNLPSVTFHGGVGQGQLAREQLKSSVLVYPCDPVRPTEGFSMTVLEGVAAGCNVVISDADAFPELWSNVPGITMIPLPVDDAVWVEAIVSRLGQEDPGVRMNSQLSWNALARRWETELQRCLTHRQLTS